MGLRKLIDSNFAVSEVLGTVLLLSIVTGLFTIVTFSVFNILPTNSTPSANIFCEADGDKIIFTHLGGDDLSLDTKIIFKNNLGLTSNILVKDYLNTTEKLDGKWNVGEKIYFSNFNLLENNIQVMVVDASGKSLILSAIVPLDNKISLTTLDVTDVSLTSAKLWLKYDFRTESGSVRFTYRSIDGGWINSSWSPQSGSGTYTFTISDLSSRMLYYFKAQLLYNSTMLQGEQKSFTTLCPSINTWINKINPYSISSSSFMITAVGDSDLDDVTLFYRWSDDNISWNGGLNELKDPVDNNTVDIDSIADKGYENNFSNCQGIIKDNNSMVIQEENSGGILNENYNYVDTQSSLHAPNDIGTHSSFLEMQDLDGIYDILTEESIISSTTTTLIDHESFEGTWPPTGWTATGQWNKESNERYSGYYSADFDGSYSSPSGNLYTPAMDCSGVDAIFIDFRTREDSADYGEYFLDFYDGTNWDQIANLDNFGDTWYHYTITITDSQYFISNFKIRWRVVGLDSSYYDTEHVYVDYVTVSKEIYTYTYNLDLEVRWSYVDYNEDNEYLCIYGGNQDLEALQIDVWNGVTWITVISDLLPSWNNISISQYLTSSNFEIRFIDATQSADNSVSSWEVEAVLLHTWSGVTDYEIDFEYQWIVANYNQANEQVCFYVSSHTGGAENLIVNYWTGSSWSSLGTITSTGWNNFTANGLISSTYTIQMKGNIESGDIIQDIWNFDVIMLVTWNLTGGQHGQNWTIWSDTNNPDILVPWSWNFNFPKGIGYYEFYSIGRDIGYCGGDIESPPLSADVICRKI